MSWTSQKDVNDDSSEEEDDDGKVEVSVENTGARGRGGSCHVN